MRIALLDLQNTRAEHYRDLFAAGGYRCHPFVRAKPFLATTLRDTFDLAILVGPPRDAALRHALLALVRRTAAPPVLMLLAQASEADMIELLNAGADDCLHEPADRAWLLARTRTLLRRGRATPPLDAAPTHFDGYRFDIVRCRAEIPGATVALTPKELALALLLFRNQGRDLSRQYLVDGVWARESGPSSRSLDTHISRIRQKLSLHPDHGYQLTAIYSHGYRLDRAAPAASISAAPRQTDASPPSTDARNGATTITLAAPPHPLTHAPAPPTASLFARSDMANAAHASIVIDPGR